MSTRYGMVIDLDRCTGCGSCMIACASENNVPALPQASPRTGLTPVLVRRVSNGQSGAGRREIFIPIMCMHCEHDTPCVRVCPQQAVEVDPATGIVEQMPQRCLGCRYCMTACPYHARYFNWWDPSWPARHGKEPQSGSAPCACAAWSRNATSVTAGCMPPKTRQRPQASERSIPLIMFQPVSKLVPRMQSISAI